MKCPICNSSSDGVSVCGKCNWKPGGEESENQILKNKNLPSTTELNARYRIYKMIKKGSDKFPYCTYTAWDTKDEKKVTIREYFPAYAERAEDKITLQEDQSIISMIKRLAPAAKKQVDEHKEKYTEYFEQNNTFYQVMEFSFGTEIGKNSDAPVIEEVQMPVTVMSKRKIWIIGGVVLLLVLVVIGSVFVIRLKKNSKNSINDLKNVATQSPSPTEVLKPTEKPVVTDAPVPTEEPVVTDAPAPTEEVLPTLIEEPEPTPEVKKEFVVTLDPAGGVFEDEQIERASTVVYGERYGNAVTAAPKKEGYTFAGWYTEEGFSVNEGSFFGLEEDQTLYARWIAETDILFTLNYYLMDSKGERYEFFQTKKEYGEADSSKALFDYATDIEGFTYYGANDVAVSEDGPNEGAFLTELTIAADGSTEINLYYSREQYSVFVDGLSSKSDVSGNGKYYYGTEVTVCCVPAKGYEFAGWSGDGVEASSNESYVFSMPAQDVYLEAEVKGKTYKVSFDSQGGDAVKAINVTYDGLFSFPSSPSKAGYSFVGWYTKASGGEEVSSGDLVQITSNLTLYAHWKAKSGISYTVNHYQENVTGLGYTLCETEQKSGTTDEKLTLVLLAKEYSGFEYVGACAGTVASSTPGSYEQTSAVLPDGTRVINIFYNRNEYTLRFDANGGTVANNMKSVSMGAQIGELPVPVKDYHNFVGWFTQSVGGSQITSAYEMPCGDMWLYAQWTEKEESGWVLESEVPSNALVTTAKWTYTLTEAKESTNGIENGWENVGSYWRETGNGSVRYAYFPETFDTSNTLYQSFEKQELFGFENENQKREVRNEWTSYIYWHWMYNVSYANSTTRAISHRRGSWDEWGNAGKGLNYQYFYAFESSVDCPYLDNKYCCSQNIPSYNCVNVMPDKSSLGTGTNRFFRFDAFTSYYTDYEKVYQYRKVTQGIESFTEVVNDGMISNVIKYVKYKEK